MPRLDKEKDREYKRAWYVSNKNKPRKTTTTTTTTASRTRWTLAAIKEKLNTLHPNSTLLSQGYKNNHTKLEFMCENDHVVLMTLSDVIGGHWCQECAGNKKLDIQDLKDRLSALYPKAMLHTTVYANNKTKLNIICESGHETEISWHDIDHGFWCGKCSSGKSEQFCKTVLEEALSVTFNKHRIYYDKSNFRRYYEIDGFSEILKLGFEYNGRQHYEYVSKFHRDNIDGHLEQQQRDKDKIQYLQSLGYYIIIIPCTVKYQKIKIYIEQEIEKWQKLKA